MTKNGNIFTYTINANDYDSIIFNYGSSQTIDLLSSSFLDGHTYDLISVSTIKSRQVGNYIK